MKIFLVSIACAVLFIAVENHAGADENFSVLFPPNKASVGAELMSVVVQARPTENDEIRLTVNKKPAAAIQISARSIVCSDGIRLSYGLNTITVAGFKKGKEVRAATVQVFYASDLSGRAGDPPPGFKPYIFHTAKNEKVCLDCHDVESKNVSEQQEKSSCYTCHKKILSEYKLAHGPSAVWSCLECHNANAKNSRFAVASPIAPVCSHCHQNEWDNKKYMHAPTAAGSCTVCHNPHASQNDYFLRLPTRSLCIACHEDILSQPHAIMGFVNGRGHPLFRDRDPFHPGKEFTCASCHSPHGGNSKAFLKNFDEKKMSRKDFCITCHKW